MIKLYYRKQDGVSAGPLVSYNFAYIYQFQNGYLYGINDNESLGEPGTVIHFLKNFKLLI